MVEDLVKLMVEQWYLPEKQVREFLSASLAPISESATGDNLEQLRGIVADLLQDHILNTPE